MSSLQECLPSVNVYQEVCIFLTRTLDPASDDAQALFPLNHQVQTGLGMRRGATHTEYIRAQAHGRLYFLETAARVGGANLAEAVGFATGVNLWTERARSWLPHPR